MSKTSFIVFLILACLHFVHTTEPQYVYTIQYVRNFNRAKLPEGLGCNYTSMTFGTYTYPIGLKDALFVYLNQGTYQSYVNCPFKQIYAKIFGTQQNYPDLIKTDPAVTAQRVRQMTTRLTPHYIVDWKCPLDLDTDQARTWLNTFVQKLSPNAKTYVKAPASYFCHKIGSQRYLLDLGKVENFIIETYGEEPGVYTTFDEIFEKQQARQGSTKENYSQNCAKYPSYQTLAKNNPSKQFFIGKTILQEQPGYIGPKLAKYLQRASKIYEKKPVFLDSFPKQIIQL